MDLYINNSKSAPVHIALISFSTFRTLKYSVTVKRLQKKIWLSSQELHYGCAQRYVIICNRVARLEKIERKKVLNNDIFLYIFNPLNHKSDGLLISLNGIALQSTVKAMRRKEVITTSRGSWLSNKFPLPLPWKCREISEENINTNFGAKN